ncbi:hypothetical protein Lnau_2516 [Legionella nautarum]|uniref:Uncharacterized protein n=1 Tax=Legionella nautarum TaxID=45070 RepID=A0A0W0WKL5_9GAMM|nr:hypothetical protein [Legionella nautarum]KTD32868.1 hypothetical protein Lnau_2516 [Legionella nautarum]
MGKENEKILLSLQTIENQIAKLESLVDLPEKLSTSLKQKIDDLRSGEEKEQDIRFDLAAFEADIADQCESFMKFIANKEGLDWRPSLYSQSSSPSKHQPLERLTIQIHHFKKVVEETNKTLLADLHKLRIRWETKVDKRREEKLGKIAQYKEEISQNPSKLCVTRELIAPLYKGSGLKAPTILETNENSLSAEERDKIALSEVIKKQQNKFNNLAALQERFYIETKELIELAQYDPQLKNGLNELRKLNQSASQLIKKTIPLLNHFLAEMEIQAQLNEAILQMTNLNQTQERLRIKILERQAMLQSNAGNPEELKKELDLAKNKLKIALECFLLTFSTINLGDKKDRDTLFFTKQLTEFIEEIITDLQAKDLSLNTQEIQGFRIQLLQHLGEKAHWYSVNAPEIQPVDKANIDEFLTELFKPVPATVIAPTRTDITANLAFIKDAKKLFDDFINTNPAEGSETLNKKQLIMLRSLADKLTSFQIKQIKNYHILKDIQVAQEEKINDLFDHLTGKIFYNKNLLQLKLMLFSNEYGSSSEVREAYGIIAQLIGLETSLKAEFSKFQQEKEKLKQLDSPLDRLSQLTDLQQAILNQFSQIDREFMGSNGLEQVTSRQISTLERTYNLDKYSLLRTLEAEIKETQAILALCYQPKQVTEILNIYSSKLQELWQSNEQQTELHLVRHTVEKLLTGLKGHKQEAWQLLNRIYEIKLSNLVGRRPPLGTRLSEINPFIIELNQYNQEVVKAIDEVITRHQLTNSIEASQMKAHLRFLDDEIRIANELINARAQVFDNAMIIETRLKSPAYQKSLYVIETMEKEYKRILDKYIDRTIETNPDEEDENTEDDQELKEKLKELKAIPGTAANYARLVEYKDYLNKVDLRLFKLLEMQLKFDEINKLYINSELLGMLTEEEQQEVTGRVIINPQATHGRLLDYADKKYALLQIDMANQTIHHTKMESLSEGVIPEFIQWIRVYILKPLQTFKHQALDYLKGEPKEKARFFPTPKTPWASQTETLLREMGNEVLPVFAAAAAATAA